MNAVKIITDSCSDLTPELMEKYNIAYARMNTVYQGKTSPALLEWKKDEVKAFYDIMRKGERITTTQVPVEEFNLVFTKYLDEGYDIVYIGCSSKCSGSVNTANVVSKKLLEKYPNQQIYCVDALICSMGEGGLAVEAAKMVIEGKSASEINEHITKIRNTMNQFVTVHSLDALKRAGRVKGSAAFFGNLMGVKPIIISNAVGDNVPVKKVKGRQNSIKEAINMLKDVIVDSENQTIYFAHADCSDEEVNSVVSQIKATIPCKEVVVGYIGPIIGASIGPDAIAIFALGKEVTVGE